jgi:hypothetical protein|tara:strand:- start:252 stop:419 length:168 start_codon:yes stop_codon:yes gene_type:complete
VSDRCTDERELCDRSTAFNRDRVSMKFPIKAPHTRAVRPDPARILKPDFPADFDN